MFVIIVGAGNVGYYLCKSLLEQGDEVLVIEKDPRKCAIIGDELGAPVINGDGCEVSCLTEAGMSRADVLVAVTGDDEDNLVACQVARHRFHVGRTIARINNPKNESIFRQLGIDVTVSSTELILSQIEEVLPFHSLVHLLTLRNVGVSFVEVVVAADSPALGKPRRELGIPDDAILALIIRKDKKAIVPFGDTVLHEGDQVIAVTAEASEPTLLRILRGQ